MVFALFLYMKVLHALDMRLGKKVRPGKALKMIIAWMPPIYPKSPYIYHCLYKKEFIVVSFQNHTNLGSVFNYLLDFLCNLKDEKVSMKVHHPS